MSLQREKVKKIAYHWLNSCVYSDQTLHLHFRPQLVARMIKATLFQRPVQGESTSAPCYLHKTNETEVLVHALYRVPFKKYQVVQTMSSHGRQAVFDT